MQRKAKEKLETEIDTNCTNTVETNRADVTFFLGSKPVEVSKVNRLYTLAILLISVNKALISNISRM